MKYVFLSILCLALLAAIQFTPLKDLLANEDTYWYMITGVAVICGIICILTMGLIGIMVGVFVGGIVAYIVTFAVAAYMPILLIAALILLLRAFRPNTKLKKKRRKYFDGKNIDGEAAEIRGYISHLQSNLCREAKAKGWNQIVEYYAAAMEELDDLVNLIEY